MITIDNFETMLDPHVLLPVLTSLANPSRFILTSRRRLIGEPNVHLHPVPELSAEHALVLLRQAAEDRELPALAACADDDLLPIYNAVGGNPLALLLVVGQTHVRPLHAVLKDLAAAPTHPPATMFGYIYRQAWEGLTTVDRQVLLAVCSAQVTDLDAASLGALCGLDAGATTAALQRLIQANLVFMEGGPRYLPLPGALLDVPFSADGGGGLDGERGEGGGGRGHKVRRRAADRSQERGYSGVPPDLVPLLLPLLAAEELADPGHEELLDRLRLDVAGLR